MVILHSVVLDRLQQKICLLENYEKIWSYLGKYKEHFGIFTLYRASFLFYGNEFKKTPKKYFFSGKMKYNFSW